MKKLMLFVFIVTGTFSSLQAQWNYNPNNPVIVACQNILDSQYGGGMGGPGSGYTYAYGVYSSRTSQQLALASAFGYTDVDFWENGDYGCSLLQTSRFNTYTGELLETFWYNLPAETTPWYPFLGYTGNPPSGLILGNSLPGMAQAGIFGGDARMITGLGSFSQTANALIQAGINSLATMIFIENGDKTASTITFINEALAAGQIVLIEGANGVNIIILPPNVIVI